MTGKIKKIFKNQFVQDLITLLSGTTISQIIYIIVSIYFTALLYSPAQFGLFFTFLTIGNIFSVIALGKYDQAIMLPEKEKNAVNILIFCLIFSLVSSLVCLILIFIFKFLLTDPNFTNLIKYSNLFPILYFLPLLILFLTVYQSFFSLLNRRKQFKILSISRIIKTSVTSVIFILAGYSGFGVYGLIAGSLIGHFFSTSYLVYKVLSNKKNCLEFIKMYDSQIIKYELISNKNFPLYLMPMAFFNSLSLNLFLGALNIISSPLIVGLYSKSNSAIRMPLSIISTSFTSVFFQKMIKTKNKIKLYSLSYLINLSIATICMLPIIFWGEELFRFVLTEKWAKAGIIGTMISPLVIFSFATSSISSVFSAIKKNEYSLIWQILYLLIGGGFLYSFRHLEINKLLLYFSIIGAVQYFILAVIGYILLKNHESNKLL